MTIIAAIATGNRVIMGCDTRTDYSGTGMYSAEGKIGILRTPNGERVLIGASGGASLVPAVRRAVKLADTPSTASASDADAWADTIADGITGALADANPPLVTTGASNGAAAIDGTLVLAWRHHLWWIYTHTASRPHSGVLALGTGADVALGSMHTSLDLNAEPEHAVDLAVRLACRYASGCGVDERGPLMYQTEPSE